MVAGLWTKEQIKLAFHNYLADASTGETQKSWHWLKSLDAPLMLSR